MIKNIILTIFLIAACITNPVEAYSQKTIAVIPKATLLHYWRVVCVGAHSASSDTDIQIIWRGPRVENKVEAQRHLLEYYIDKNVDAIVIAPTHRDKLNYMIRKARNKGIKIVVIDSPITEDIPHSTIATDNYKAGCTGARLLLENVSGKGPLLLMGNMPDSSSILNREQGFIDTIHELAPGRTIIRANFIEGTRREAENSAYELLNGEREIAGIFAVNESSTEGTLLVLKRLGLSEIPFIGFDYNHKLITGVETGFINALITQTPYAMGYVGVRSAIELLEGKDVFVEMESPVKIITAKNIKEGRSLRCLKDFSEDDQGLCPICFN